MNRSVIFITGTDTGVGKTVFTGLLAGHFHNQGVRAAALKPVCSGDREDAKYLRTASRDLLTLNEINPWHFRAPLTPLVAARMEKRRLRRAQVTTHVRRIQKRFPAVLVEGAGGLLSPLGENFDSRDLIVALNATPIVLCPNRLGAINQVLLVLAALPRNQARRAQVVLVSPPRPTMVSRTNPRLLAEIIGHRRIHILPRLKQLRQLERTVTDPRVDRALKRIVLSIPGEW